MLLALSGADVSGRLSAPVAADAPEPWDLEFARLKFDDAAASAGAERPPAADPHRGNETVGDQLKTEAVCQTCRLGKLGNRYQFRHNAKSWKG